MNGTLTWTSPLTGIVNEETAIWILSEISNETSSHVCPGMENVSGSGTWSENGNGSVNGFGSVTWIESEILISNGILKMTGNETYVNAVN